MKPDKLSFTLADVQRKARQEIEYELFRKQVKIEAERLRKQVEKLRNRGKFWKKFFPYKIIIVRRD